MTALAFLVPLFTFYGLLVCSVGAGLVACLGSCLTRRRRSWLLVTGIVAIVGGGLLNYSYRSIIWGAATEALWFTLLGVSPIPLGGVAVGVWFLRWG
jgi:hypothetical protein